mgnify:CR=1 FL=1
MLSQSKLEFQTNFEFENFEDFSRIVMKMRIIKWLCPSAMWRIYKLRIIYLQCKPKRSLSKFWNLSLSDLSVLCTFQRSVTPSFSSGWACDAEFGQYHTLFNVIPFPHPCSVVLCQVAKTHWVFLLYFTIVINDEKNLLFVVQWQTRSDWRICEASRLYSWYTAVQSCWSERKGDRS